MINKILVAFILGVAFFTCSFLPANADASEGTNLSSTTTSITDTTSISTSTTAGADATPIAASPTVSTDVVPIPTPATTPAAAESTPSKSTSKQTHTSSGKFTHKVGALIVGIASTPVAIVSQSKKATFSDTNELIGDHKNPLILVPAVMLSIPFGITTGAFEGTSTALGNLWKLGSP